MAGGSAAATQKPLLGVAFFMAMALAAAQGCKNVFTF